MMQWDACARPIFHQHTIISFVLKVAISHEMLFVGINVHVREFQCPSCRELAFEKS